MSNTTADQLFSHPLGKVDDFTFDEKVASVFPDMINRSVPGYSTIVATIGMLAEHFSQADSNCYDLGCSLGACTFAMADAIQDQNIKIIGVDNSPAMLKRCHTLLEEHPSKHRVQLINSDLQDAEISSASVIVMNFTLQFIELKQRDTLIQRLYDKLLPGGALILSEKVLFNDQQLQGLFTDLHHDFKRAQGYSNLEISQKRSAIENVLIPESLSTHHQRLKQAGFRDSAVWFQCFNFASLVAVK